MKTVNESIKKALKKPTTQRKGRILVNGSYYDVYNVEYYADCYDEGRVIGNAIATQLDFDLPYIGKFDTFKYFDGIWTGQSYEYIDLGTFEVFDENNEDNFFKHITAFDNLIKFNKPFEERGTYPKTLYQELQNVCEQAGVTLATATIPNGNFLVENNQFVSGENLKSVLKQICSITGNFAVIKNDSLHLLLKNQTNEIIDKSQHQLVNWKRRSYGINQVILGDSQVEGEYVLREDPEDIALNGVHKLVINDNLFAYTQSRREALIDALFQQVKGFGYIPYEMDAEWLNYWEIGDVIQIDNIETIVLRISAKSPTALNTTISAPAIIDNAIDYIDNTDDIENRLKITERSVDKQNQIISDTVSEVTEQNEKITQVMQTVDEINAKISDIADVTVTAESEYARVELDDINASEPITVQIYPNSESISYLYPRNNLYPSNNLFSTNRILRFEASYEEYDYDIGEMVTKIENIDYELPDDLLYYNGSIYDEFYLDYDSETCYIKKRCGYNADGTVYPLAEERQIDIEYPTINLIDGDYKVYVLGYTSAHIFVRLMAKNIYTTQFATRVEMRSAIEQSAEEINIEVDRKTDRQELVAKINLVPGEIKLEGTVTNGENFRIKDDGSIEAYNGSFSGDIYLGNGGKVIGGLGILTNMQFIGTSYNTSQLNNTEGAIGSTGGGFLGISGDDYNRQNFHYYKTYHAAQVFIPKNFTVERAYITVIHSPVYYSYGSTSGYGYVRNMRAYNITGSFGVSAEIIGQSYSLGNTPTLDSYTEISGAFGTSGKTFSNSMPETVTSEDISSIFNGEGNYTIAIATGNTPGSDTSTINYSRMYPYTGFATMCVNIIGYMSSDVE